MKNSNLLTKKTAGLLLAFAVMIGNTIPVSAEATTQQVQGNNNQQKQVEVTADIKAVYSVSLPASITLEAGNLKNASFKEVSGYWYRLKYGVAGKIPSNKKVFVRPIYPCVINILDDSSNVLASLDVIDYTHADECLGGGNCKTEWTSSEIGSCDYDGINVSNCNYSYCCNNGHWIGVKTSDVSTCGSYSGNLTFEIGVE